MKFIVDTGAQHSIIVKPLKKPTSQTITVVGATGYRQEHPFHSPVPVYTRMSPLFDEKRFIKQITGQNHLHSQKPRTKLA